MLACTPGVLAPCSINRPDCAQASWSASLLRMTWAHLSPGRFQPFEAEVEVSVWPAVTSLSEAYGMCRCPG